MSPPISSRRMSTAVMGVLWAQSYSRVCITCARSASTRLLLVHWLFCKKTVKLGDCPIVSWGFERMHCYNYAHKASKYVNGFICHRYIQVSNHITLFVTVTQKWKSLWPVLLALRAQRVVLQVTPVKRSVARPKPVETSYLMGQHNENIVLIPELNHCVHHPLTILTPWLRRLIEWGQSDMVTIKLLLYNNENCSPCNLLLYCKGG